MTSVSFRSQLPWSTSDFQFRDDKRKLSFSVRIPAKASLRLGLTVSPGAQSPSVSRAPVIRCSSDASPTETDSRSSPPSIFIKGFPRSTSEARLKKAFSEFGRVLQVKILTHRETGDSLGAAYIWMNRPEYAELAVKQMHGAFFDGKYISLTIPKGSIKREKKESTFEF